jgi:hypothetical protein
MQGASQYVDKRGGEVNQRRRKKVRKSMPPRLSTRWKINKGGWQCVNQQHHVMAANVQDYA